MLVYNAISIEICLIHFSIPLHYFDWSHQLIWRELIGEERLVTIVWAVLHLFGKPSPFSTIDFNDLIYFLMLWIFLNHSFTLVGVCWKMSFVLYFINQGLLGAHTYKWEAYKSFCITIQFQTIIPKCLINKLWKINSSFHPILFTMKYETLLMPTFTCHPITPQLSSPSWVDLEYSPMGAPSQSPSWNKAQKSCAWWLLVPFFSFNFLATFSPLFQYPIFCCLTKKNHFLVKGMVPKKSYEGLVSP